MSSSVHRDPLNPRRFIRIPDKDSEKNKVSEPVEEYLGIPYSEAPIEVKLKLEKERFEEEFQRRGPGRSAEDES